jgi:hypothetical protein
MKPSCWPLSLCCAPVGNYSPLDTWLRLLPADRSAFHILAPALLADLTRLSTLGACDSCGLLRSRHRAPVLFTGHPVPRIAPCSALRTPSRLRIAPHTSLGFFASFPDCSVLAAFRSAQPSDCSASCAWLSMPVYGLLRTLTLPALVRFADCSAFLPEFRTGTDFSVSDA